MLTVSPNMAIATPYPTNVSFNIKVQCTVSYTPPFMADILYPTVGEFHIVGLTLTVPMFTWNPAGCVTSQTWSPTTGITPPLESFISYNTDSLTIDTNGVKDDPDVCGYCADYVVKISAVPQPSNMLQYTAPYTTFNLKVYEPCSITSLKPTSTTTVPAVINRNLQTETTPTFVTIPSFSVVPTDCGVFTYTAVLFETTSGSRVEIASYNPDTVTATSTSPYIKMNNLFQL